MGSFSWSNSGDGPVTTATTSCHKLGVAVGTGPRRDRTALVTTLWPPEKPAALTVGAHHIAASPTVSGSLREQTDREEEEEEGAGGGAEQEMKET